MNDVFISYSTEDSSIAFRIYTDLSRSGICVFLYERDGENGVEFRNEIYSIIDNSHTICLIDSPSSRASRWVREECRYSMGLIDKTKPVKRIVPCIIEKPGDWFFNNEHFPNQSAIRGIDFSSLNYLDYKEKYVNSISQLCNNLNTVFTPWSGLPNERDFEKELSLFSVTDPNKEFLISDYRNFVLSTNSNSKTKLGRILNLLSDCERLGIQILTCHLALGAIYAENNDDNEALKVFRKVCQQFPQDARGWAALGGVLFYLQEYNESLYAINNALKIVEQFPDNDYLQRHKSEIIYNKVQILIQQKEYNQASILLNQYPNLFLTPEHLCAKIKLSIFTGNNNFSHLYKTLVRNYYDFRLNTKVLNTLIGELEFQLGRYYVSNNDYNSGLNHYKNACKIQGKNLQYTSNYFLLQFASKQLNKKELEHKLNTLDPKNSSDYYYYGLLYYLKNDFEAASKYYTKSGLSWNRYDELIEY